LVCSQNDCGLFLESELTLTSIYQMRKFYILPLLAAICIFTLSAAILRNSGSPGAKTGSPGDGANCTQCHGGTVKSATNWITTTIPDKGFKPDSTYTITLTASVLNIKEFGFELTAEDSKKIKKGTFVLTNTTETSLINNNKAVTHTTKGTPATNGAKTWQFNWKAPADATGDITFYAAINASDNNGSTSGDAIYLTSFKAVLNTSTDINQPQPNDLIYKIFPNPATGVISVEVDRNSVYTQIINQNAQVVYESILNSGTNTLNLQPASGIYYIKFKTNNNIYIEKVVIR